MDNIVMALQVQLTFFFPESFLSFNIEYGTLETDELLKVVRFLKFSCIIFAAMFAGYFAGKTQLGVSHCLQGKLYVVKLGK